MFDFILDLKDIQTISKWETPKITKIFCSELIEFIEFIKFVENKLTVLKQLLVFLPFLLRKKYFLFQNVDPRN